MIDLTLQDYFKATVHSHVARFFDPVAGDWLVSIPIRCVRLDELTDQTPVGVYLITDLALAHRQAPTRRIPFNGTQITTWEPVMAPGPRWRPWPSAEQPLFHQSPSGALTPSWNLLALCLDLLLLGEESRDGRQDSMQRFIAAFSPRQSMGLLDIPVFNEAVASLVLAVGALANECDSESIVRLMQPKVKLCLSHDLDQLRGNDKWTQGARGYRMVQQLKNRELPDPKPLWWMARNAVRPWTFYEGNVRGMLELESMLGFRSTLYFLNGTGGRFGARSGTAAVERLTRGALKVAPDCADYGIHYNFDSASQDGGLATQIEELTRVLGTRPKSGRAHYLLYEGFASMKLWEEHGIVVDESLGYPDAVGFRSGIAGPYHPLDPATGEVAGIAEMPLALMDGPLLAEEDPLGRFAALVHHLGRVGGALSLLFHPGVFDNPELPDARFLYRELLEVARLEGAESCTALEMVSGP